jgi:NADPH:quinone reductase-like Zn-dependent oxidoreductase
MEATINAVSNVNTQAERPMRALLQSGYGSVEVLRLGERARPKPGKGEVLLEVRAAGVDRGTWHMMTGRPYLMRLMGFGFSAPKNPVPGLDVAGVVLEVGPQVTRFRPGDEVFGIAQGSFAELSVAREDKLAAKPQGLSFEEAAVLGVSGLTALGALDAAAVQAGERVLIVGASGGVGTMAVQLAKALGAEVTGVCSTTKVERVRGLGADRVIDYRQQDFADGTIRYDVILDVGGNTPLGRLRRALSPVGRLVFVGGENGGDWTAGFGRPLGALLLGAFVKQRFIMLANKEHYAGLERLAAQVQAGALRPLVDRSISLAEVPEAIRALEAGGVTGKVAVTIG